MKRTLLIIVLSLFSLSLLADVLKGRVVDAMTNEPLPEAEVDVYLVLASVGYADSWSFSVRTDSVGVFFVEKDKVNGFEGALGGSAAVRAKVTANYFGYKSASKSAMLLFGNDTVNVGDIKLKPGKALLKEVKVTGRIPHFTMSGDTVVFHPEAFHMDNADRVYELIRKLPGIEVTEDGIKWNGRKVKLKMNGNDVFGDGAMLGELPVEAVKNIKTYEKKSEFAERIGVEDGKGEQVLDINIKPSFMDKLYGSVTAAGYTNKMYDGRLDVNRLSADNPVMFSGRVGEGGAGMSGVGFGPRYSVWIGGSSGVNDLRQQAASLGYQHAWDSKWKESKWRNSYDIIATASHTDNMRSTWSREQLFKDDGNDIFRNSTSDIYNHGMNVPLTLTYKKNVTAKTTFTGQWSFALDKSIDTETSESTEKWLSDLAPRMTKNSCRVDDSRRLNIHTEETLEHFFANGRISETFKLIYTDIDADGDYQADYVNRDSVSVTNTRDVQQKKSITHNFLTSSTTKYSHSFGKTMGLDLYYDIFYANEYYSNDVMRGDGAMMAADFTNSLSQRNQNIGHTASVSAWQNIGSLNISESVSLRNDNQHFDYRRGKIDTLAVRSVFAPRASVNLNWKINNKSGLWLYTSWWQGNPDIMQTLGYYDDTDLHNVTIGNPQLEKYSDISATLRYYYTIPKGQQNINIAIYGSKSYNPIMTLRRYYSKYNGLSDVYVNTDINGRGGGSASLSIGYTRSMFNVLRMSVECSYGTDVTYSREMIINDVETTDMLCHTVNNYRFKPSLSYDSNRWNIKLWGDMSKRDATYNLSGYADAHEKECFAGLELKYKMEHWDFSFTPKLESRRGYLSDMMNKDRVLADAELTWKFMKKKARLSLVANDIFNQLETIRSNMTSESRYESGRSYLHHFIGMTFNYRFDAKEKKK
ncbi:MAG: TonB-dependent receptor [Bacteroidaceae bacterium]|nr:TonB-dependent receptor [Bacteroidaceae bacterium]